MSSKRHYFTTDGNGGFNISKSLIFIALVLSVLTPLVAVLVQGALMQQDIDNLQIEMTDAGPRHTDIIIGLEEDIDDNENNIIAINTKLDNIQDTLNEIKEQLK